MRARRLRKAPIGHPLCELRWSHLGHSLHMEAAGAACRGHQGQSTRKGIHMAGDGIAIGRRRFIKGAVAASAAAAVAAGSAGSALASDGAKMTYADGTYEAVGSGIGGDVPVTVTIKGGIITSVEVGENAETQGVGSKAIEQLPDEIVKANGTKGVSAVSGASVTSKAIFTAVEDCLAQASGMQSASSAKIDSSEIILTENIYSNAKWSFEIPPAPIPEDKITETITADFIVVGAGTSGLMTAMAANEDGVDVIVIAASDKPVSRGGSNAAFNSRLQKELGREMPLEDAINYFQEQFNAGSWRMDQDKWWDFYNYSGEAMDWLMDKMDKHGIQTVIEQTYIDPTGNMSVPSFSHTFINADNQAAGASQQIAVEAMADEILSNGGRIDYQTTGEQLEKDDSGRITGIIAKNPSGDYVRYTANKGVILATGDFSQDKDMVAKYCPLALQYGNGGVYDGSGHKMALWAGAAWQKYTPNAPMICSMGDEVLPCRWWASGAGTAFPGLLVNAKGRRYCDENSLYGYSAYPQNVQPGHCSYLIWDDKWVFDSAPWLGDYIGSPDRDTQEVYDQIQTLFTTDASQSATAEYAGFDANMGTAVKADTIEELAEGLGFEGEALDEFLAQVERYNGYCETKVDEEFHKAERFLLPVKTPPFYGVRNEPYMLCVTGGLNTDRQQHVLDKDSNILPGLYAVGTLIGDTFGDIYDFRIWGHNLGMNCVTAGYMLGKRLKDIDK